jgi:PBSX family phage portal protein
MKNKKTEKMIEDKAGAEVFTFGEAVPILDKVSVMALFQANHDGKIYLPIVSLDGLAKSLHSSPHHESAIRAKANTLASSVKSYNYISRADFLAIAMDYLIFGNLYLEFIHNKLGQLLNIKHMPAKFMRKKYVKTASDKGRFIYLYGQNKQKEYKPGQVIHVKNPDVNQEIYGIPEYLSALNAAWLNEAGTIFRRRYFENGNHAGFILHLTDASMSKEEAAQISKSIGETKGVGNFKNLMVFNPSGTKDGLKIHPFSEITAKDEFFNIKNVTRDDILSAHRVPPQLLGIIPQGSSGLGDVEKALRVFMIMEIQPLQEVFKQINDAVGKEVITFKPIPSLDDKA